MAICPIRVRALRGDVYLPCYCHPNIQLYQTSTILHVAVMSLRTLHLNRMPQTDRYSDRCFLEGAEDDFFYI